MMKNWLEGIALSEAMRNSMTGKSYTEFALF